MASRPRSPMTNAPMSSRVGLWPRGLTSRRPIAGATRPFIAARSRRGRIDILLMLGADINNTSASIGTPLHAAAHAHNVENACLLLESGAQIDALNRGNLTPLELALRGCSNIDLQNMAPLAETLLAAGARKTPRMKELHGCCRTQLQSDWSLLRTSANAADLKSLHHPPSCRS